MLLSTFNPKSGPEAWRSGKFFSRDIFHKYGNTGNIDVALLVSPIVPIQNNYRFKYSFKSL